jgi:hypothetical protein
MREETDGWRGSLQRWLAASESRFFGFSGIVCFSLYFLVYFWRVSWMVLPDIAGKDAKYRAFGMDLKSAFACGATIGFGLSKVPAMRYVSAAPNNGLAKYLIGTIVLSSLIIGVGIAVLPPAGKVIAVFIASFPASWIYGTMLRYIEGRTQTEPLAGLISVSWIFGGGACRAATSALLSANIVPPFYVPLFLVGIVLVPAVLLSILLDAVPLPTEKDKASRCEHKPMPLREQWRFFLRFLPGFVFLLSSYTMLTAFRGFRDAFLSDIINEALGHDLPSSFYLAVEIPGGLVAAALFSASGAIRNNGHALLWMLCLQGGGAAVIGLAQVLYSSGRIGVAVWNIGISLGMYISYCSMGVGVYDRLIAITRTEGTCVFLAFLSDGLGYLGTIAILLYKTYSSGSEHESYASFFEAAALTTSVGVGGLSVCAAFYFQRAVKNQPGAGQDIQADPKEALLGGGAAAR